MIIFYNTVTGLCIRPSDGISSEIAVVDGKAYRNGELVLGDMTDVDYTDIIYQSIYNYDENMIATPKLFSSLKQGVPDEVRIAALEDAMLELLGGGT